MNSKSILIIGTQRSGTESLCFSLNSQIKGETMYGKYSSREPWNYNSPFVNHNDNFTDWTKTPYDLDLIKSKSIVLKTQSFQKPKHYPGTSVEFIQELATRFDRNRIISLCRRNYDEHIRSYTNLRYKVYKNGYWTGLAQKKWKYSDIPQEYFHNNEEQEIIHKYVTEQRKFLQEASDKLDIDISWYEDLYGEDRDLSLNLIKSWRLEIDEYKVNDDLNPKHKLEISKSKTML